MPALMNQFRAITNDAVVNTVWQTAGRFPPALQRATSRLPWRALARELRSQLIACAAAALLGGAGTAVAVEPATAPLANLSRQGWAMESGLPQNTVQALVQARDGFVWLGTEAGLVRFDGIAFQVFDRNSNPALPGSDVRCLFESRDGALWIGTSEGLTRWKGLSVTAYSTRNGLPGNGIRMLTQSGDGVLWVWTDLGLARLSGGEFVRDTAGLGEAAITAVLADGQGSLRVEGARQAAEYRNGRWTGIATVEGFPDGGLAYWAPLSNGVVAFASRTTVELMQGKRTVARLTVGKELPGNRIQALFADRGGSLWIGTSDGLAEWTNGKLERPPMTDPLATASVLALMEDREGDLWVGTESDGLHILRDQRFRIIDTREGLSSDATTAVIEDAKGTLWVGTQETGLNALRRSSTGVVTARTLTVEHGLASNVILSLAAAPNGDLWVGTPDGLNRIRGSSIATFTSIDGLPDDFIRSLLIDVDGSLWIGTRRGLTHWEIGSASKTPSTAEKETYTHANGLGSDLVGAMARDAHGDLWVATLVGLSRLHRGAISNFTTADGLSSNVVTALLPHADGTLLIGTQDHGWNVWDGRRFSAATRNGIEQTSIHAILEDGEGHDWFATGNGIARCDCVGSGPDYSRWIEFSTADGLRSRETATNSHPSAWRSGGGQLWFATPKGLVEVDPAHFRVNSLPPPVALERFQVDDVSQPLLGAESKLKVEAGHVHFEFDYAGLSFVAPLKVRYRYMLEGFDHGWTEAGSRRTAYYTNIPAGRYTFRVQAANNDGVWNTTGAALSFELRPHFYQTLWFYALLLAAVGAGIVLLLRRRLRQAEREFRAVLGERSRIAREIHDTLAQGYVGISVQLEVISELLRLRKLDDVAQRLNQTREYVREGLADARQSIWALRTQDGGETTLPVKLQSIAESAGGGALKSNFSIFGAYRPLPTETERELLRVAQEAIHNVKKHADASELSVQLEYKAEAVVLEVRDNGRGGAAADAIDSSAGHFGLTGMRERATAIGGTLEVTSAPGAGTTIRLCAPARLDVSEKTGATR